MPMIQTAIAALLTDSFGFDTEIIGPEMVQRAVRDRMLDSGFTDPAAYLLRLQSSYQELELLGEHLLVPETWFFRDRGPFEYLQTHARSNWIPSAGGRLRLLSVPCSTGEEPFSMAMSLLDIGLPGDAVHIDAVDMSRSALRQARTGVYGENSFRGEDLTFRDRYFEPTNGGYTLRSELKRIVNFIRVNIAAENLLENAEPYDAVFCRNLLIYFDLKARDRLVNNLVRLVKPEGILCLGAAETSQVPTAHFISVKQVKSFAFQRKTALQPGGGRNGERPISRRIFGQAADQSVSGRRPEPDRERPGRSFAQLPSPGNASAVPPPNPPGSRVESRLDRAQSLADEGDLEAAAGLCRECLLQDQGNARAYFLLGLISQAAGKLEEAEECLDRTIYLEPKHREALVSRSLIAADRGDHDIARRLMERAEKCA